MIAYVDTSVILNSLLKQSHPSIKWKEWSQIGINEIGRLEALRTIDRVRLMGELSDEEVSVVIETLNHAWARMNEIPLTKTILKRAELPFPTVVRTLDAIHLTSAYLWQEEIQKEVVFLTHDIQLGRAAKAMGLRSECAIESTRSRPA